MLSSWPAYHLYIALWRMNPHGTEPPNKKGSPQAASFVIT
jgi:hypothetical protein